MGNKTGYEKPPEDPKSAEERKEEFFKNHPKALAGEIFKERCKKEPKIKSERGNILLLENKDSHILYFYVLKASYNGYDYEFYPTFVEKKYEYGRVVKRWIQTKLLAKYLETSIAGKYKFIGVEKWCDQPIWLYNTPRQKRIEENRRRREYINEEAKMMLKVLEGDIVYLNSSEGEDGEGGKNKKKKREKEKQEGGEGEKGFYSL